MGEFRSAYLGYRGGNSKCRNPRESLFSHSRKDPKPAILGPNNLVALFCVRRSRLPAGR